MSMQVRWLKHNGEKYSPIVHKDSVLDSDGKQIINQISSHFSDYYDKTEIPGPICTATPTTTSTASNTHPAVVVENYINGSNWYRVWSDGFIEQGGNVGGNASDTITAVSYITFPKRFTNLGTISVFATIDYRGRSDMGGSVAGARSNNMYNLSVTGFGCVSYMRNDDRNNYWDRPGSWFAMGY